ncbi:MAG: hypothetical protein OXI93_00935 [Bryobacterales bacterium]|nr:hypothetical protein [Bryobacterales bacterium]
MSRCRSVAIDEETVYNTAAFFLRNYLWELLAYIAYHPTAEARGTTARTSLRLLAVLNVLFKYACARQAARVSS